MRPSYIIQRAELSSAYSSGTVRGHRAAGSDADQLAAAAALALAWTIADVAADPGHRASRSRSIPLPVRR
jgi:hypothetical protein